MEAGNKIHGLWFAGGAKSEHQKGQFRVANSALSSRSSSRSSTDSASAHSILKSADYSPTNESTAYINLRAWDLARFIAVTLHSIAAAISARTIRRHFDRLNAMSRLIALALIFITFASAEVRTWSARWISVAPDVRRDDLLVALIDPVEDALPDEMIADGPGLQAMLCQRFVARPAI